MCCEAECDKQRILVNTIDILNHAGHKVEHFKLEDLKVKNGQLQEIQDDSRERITQLLRNYEKVFKDIQTMLQK